VRIADVLYAVFRRQQEVTIERRQVSPQLCLYDPAQLDFRSVEIQSIEMTGLKFPGTNERVNDEHSPGLEMARKTREGPRQACVRTGIRDRGEETHNDVERAIQFERRHVLPKEPGAWKLFAGHGKHIAAQICRGDVKVAAKEPDVFASPACHIQ
jgi:hypothetical protein